VIAEIGIINIERFDEIVMVLEAQKPTHCQRCGEWLDVYTACPECEVDNQQ